MPILSATAGCSNVAFGRITASLGAMIGALLCLAGNLWGGPTSSCQKAFLSLPTVTPNEIKFGFEPQATNSAIWNRGDDPVYARAWKRLSKELSLLKPDGKILGMDSEGVRFQDSEGGIYRMSRDDRMLETQPPPMFLPEIEKKLTPLFEAFKKAGLRTELPSRNGIVYGASAAIHVDRGIFEKNPILLRNVLVFEHNHPSLVSIFRWFGDHRNANTLFENSEHEQFAAILKKVDKKAKNNALTFDELKKQLASLFKGSRYRSINLTNLWSHTAPPTVEFRLFMGQRNAQDISDQATFLGYLLQYLSRAKTPLPIEPITSEVEQQLKRGPRVAREDFLEIAKTIGLPAEVRDRILSPERFARPSRLEGSGKSLYEVRHYDQLSHFEARPPARAAEYVELVTPPNVYRLEVKPINYPIPDSNETHPMTLDGKAHRIAHFELPFLSQGQERAGVKYSISAYGKDGKLIPGSQAAFVLRYLEENL